jgi:acetyl esterase/lipase
LQYVTSARLCKEEFSARGGRWSAPTSVPVWAFHGGADVLVPVQASRLMVQAVRAAGGTACYTEYPGANHDIWYTKRPMSDPLVLAWLFSQTKVPDPNSVERPLPCPPGH